MHSPSEIHVFTAILPVSMKESFVWKGLHYSMSLTIIVMIKYRNVVRDVTINSTSLQILVKSNNGAHWKMGLTNFSKTFLTAFVRTASHRILWEKNHWLIAFPIADTIPALQGKDTILFSCQKSFEAKNKDVTFTWKIPLEWIVKKCFYIQFWNPCA